MLNEKAAIEYLTERAARYEKESKAARADGKYVKSHILIMTAATTYDTIKAIRLLTNNE